VMMSQNRQAAKDRDEAEHDYDVNRDALARLTRLETGQLEIHDLLVSLAAGPADPRADPR
jgi:uncharacterized membrane protein